MLRLLNVPLHHYVPVRASLVTGPTELESALKTHLHHAQASARAFTPLCTCVCVSCHRPY